MKKNLITELICGLLIFLFVYTATSKWLAFQQFKGLLQGAPYIHPFAPFLSRALPLAELGVALMLCLPRLRRAGLFAALGLLLAFTGYLALMMLLSAHLPCSCGGVLNQLSWGQHLVLNGCFILLNLWAIHQLKKYPQGPPKILRNQAKPKTCINE